MINIFLVRYRDGGVMLEALPVKTQNRQIKGEPTNKALDGLINRGYTAWVNLSGTINDPRYKVKELLIKEFGI